MPERATPFTATARGVSAAVHVVPKSSASAISGVARDANGETWLKVCLRATPEKGKANAALIKLLAKGWGLSPSRLSITAGANARRKTLLVRGEGAALMQALAKLNQRTT